MKRRFFLQKAGVVSATALLTTPTDLLASESPNCQLDLSSIMSQGKNFFVNGFAFDAISNASIDAVFEIKSGYGLFTKTRKATIKNGQYSIIGNTLKEGLQKIKVKIEAQGYKTFEGSIYLSNLGCRIHSDMWKYNPNFKPEFTPKNDITADLISSKFNFYMVRA